MMEVVTTPEIQQVVMEFRPSSSTHWMVEVTDYHNIVVVNEISRLRQMFEYQTNELDAFLILIDVVVVVCLMKTLMMVNDWPLEVWKCLESRRVLEVLFVDFVWELRRGLWIHMDCSMASCL
jgi:hypothetical protein